MNIAFIIFNEMTMLDFIGIYDPITRLKTLNLITDLRWDICATEQRVYDDRGLCITSTIQNQFLGTYDVLVIPGGLGTRKLQHERSFIEWLRTADKCPIKISVCTGALLLGAAGYLKNRHATTHPKAFKELEPYCERIVNERIVDDGKVITSGGVTSAIDAGLYAVEIIFNREAREKIALQMDYKHKAPVYMRAVI